MRLVVWPEQLSDLVGSGNSCILRTKDGGDGEYEKVDKDNVNKHKDTFDNGL